jgi:hypothetical protein
MAQRQISEDQVESALRRRTGPPQPGDNGNLVVFGYGSGSRILKVVITPDQTTVVTVMEHTQPR